MRIFERLRGRSRSESAIERRTFRGRYRRSLAETRGRNLDPGFHREQSPLLFLLLGRRKDASIGRLCARSICACRFGDKMIADAQRCSARLASRSRAPNSATSARPGLRRCVSRASARSGVWHNVWMDDALLIHPTHRRSRCQDAIWMRSCWPRACRTASQRPALPFRPAERPWPDPRCRDFRPRSSQPCPCRSAAGTLCRRRLPGRT